MADKASLAIAIIAIIIAVIAIGYAAYTASTLSSQIKSINNKLSAIESRIGSLEHRVSTFTARPTATPTRTATVTGKVTLTVIGPWAGKEAKYFEKVIQAFEAEHPNIKIKYVIRRAEELAQILPLQFSAHTTPGDVIITPWAWFIVKMAKEGHVVDLTGIIKPSDYIDGIVENVMWNGHVYGAPFTMWLKPGFWYRKSFFKKYGLHVPKTWEDFLNLLKKIKKIPGIKNPIVSGDSKGWPLSDIVEHFLLTFLGPDITYKLVHCEVKFTDPEVENVFKTKLVPLIKEGYFSPPIEWTTAIEKWWAGEYALYFMGTWIAGMVPNASDIDFFWLPGDKAIVGGADYAFIPKYTKHLQAALTFLKFLATEGQVIHASTPAGKIPTWKKAPVDKIWEPMQSVYKKVTEAGMKIVPDLDDTIGGHWQTLFWDQLKLLWVDPSKLPQILKTLTEQLPACKAKG